MSPWFTGSPKLESYDANRPMDLTIPLLLLTKTQPPEVWRTLQVQKISQKMRKIREDGMFATFHGHSGVSFDQDWLMGAKIIIDGMSLGHCVSMSFGFSKNTTGQTGREKRSSQDRNSRQHIISQHGPLSNYGWWPQEGSNREAVQADVSQVDENMVCKPPKNQPALPPTDFGPGL